jgi:hypothetical protein
MSCAHVSAACLHTARRTRTAMPNCLSEDVYQNRWNRIWAVASATCFLP